MSQATNTLPLIQIYRRSVYGSTYSYIKDPDIASHMQGLTQNKTLSPKDIKHLQALGFSFEEVLAPND